MIPEIFLPIKDYEESYHVSFFGRVKSLGASGSGKSKVDIIMKDANNGRGYRYVTLMKDNKRKNFYIHKLVVEAFLPLDSERLDINHKNGIKWDNHISNLERCSKSENMIHAGKNGLMNYWRRINKEDILELRRLDKMGMSRKDLALKFNISRPQVHRIIHLQAWKNI